MTEKERVAGLLNPDGVVNGRVTWAHGVVVPNANVV